MTACKICNSKTEKIFSKTVLKKYPADYFRCTQCDFVQASEPVWIEEAYPLAIHVFTPVTLTADQVNYAFKDASYKSGFFGLIKTPYSFKKSRPSLLEQDYQYIKQKIK